MVVCYSVPGCFSCVWLFVTPCTIARQAPLSMGFSRQEYWSGLSCPPPGDLPDPGIGPTSLVSPAMQVDSLPTQPPGKSGSGTESFNPLIQWLLPPVTSSHR